MFNGIDSFGLILIRSIKLFESIGMGNNLCTIVYIMFIVHLFSILVYYTDTLHTTYKQIFILK